MKVNDVINCSFPSWYNNFKEITAESIILPLPSSFITYLHTDGLVLPQSSTHGLVAKSGNLAMDGDDDDEDIRDDDLMKMYEDDWSTPTTANIAEAPEFGEFDKQVEAAIKKLGGRVFPKLNWSSPKDASWISFDKTLMCTCPSDVYLLLKSSEFIAHDLDQPFIQCENYKDKEPDHPPVSYCLVLRRWHPPDPSSEFRCFVHGDKLIGISQRNTTKLYSHIVKEKDEIVQDILAFFNKSVKGKFSNSSNVFDVVRWKKGNVTLVDFNPWGPVTDGLLFTWEELAGLVGQTESRGKPCFRCVESESGVQCSDYGNYAFPRDIQDLAAGEDPYKLMDLMKLEIQKPGEDSTSSEGEDDNEEKDSMGDGGVVDAKTNVVDEHKDEDKR